MTGGWCHPGTVTAKRRHRGGGSSVAAGSGFLNAAGWLTWVGQLIGGDGR